MVLKNKGDMDELSKNTQWASTFYSLCGVGDQDFPVFGAVVHMVPTPFDFGDPLQCVLLGRQPWLLPG